MSSGSIKSSGPRRPRPRTCSTTGEFIHRRDNLCIVGQSGVGKSHMIQAIGHSACACGHRVRYITSAALLKEIIDARSRQRSTALVTNIDFDAWGDYLGDPPLAMAFLDRIVDGAIILKIKGKSYRAHRARPTNGAEAPKSK